MNFVKMGMMKPTQYVLIKDKANCSNCNLLFQTVHVLNHVEDQVIVCHFNKIALMVVAAIIGVLSIQIVLLERDVSEANVKGEEGQYCIHMELLPSSLYQQPPSLLQLPDRLGVTRKIIMFITL